MKKMHKCYINQKPKKMSMKKGKSNKGTSGGKNASKKTIY